MKIEKRQHKNKRRFFLSLLYVFFIFYILFFYLKTVYAADFRRDYQVEYFLTKNKNSLNTRVNFNIKITNLRSDIYVAKFAISFPKSFIIHNLEAADDRGLITPEIVEDEEKMKVNLAFTNPSTGKGSVNNFYLKFNQENLFKINGNVWEVILPTIEGKEEGVYKVIVYLPEDTPKKIAISKPKPDKISGNQIIWVNPQAKTIYAVFGERQFYQTELVYHLNNPKLIPIITEVAFPPDTLYQKIYIQSINPSPDKTLTDEDGNFLGRYRLSPKETKKIIFNGVIEVSNNPREQLIPVIRNQFVNQKRYLLTSQKYWEIDKPLKLLDSPEKIYSYVVNNLKYNYKRVVKGNQRLGAAKALISPTEAVCTEFTDLFIALAREKGIWAREIEGYGFSFDSQIRPLSLISDVLHAWPEYYDKKRELWIPVDPTWENTSGIDYFSSFDLNHIVFAIHGKQSDYPLPAGMYKIEDSRDIEIKAINNQPEEKIALDVKTNQFPSKLTDKEIFKAKFTFQNLGNTYRWQIPVKLMVKNIDVDPSQFNIPLLVPQEKKEIVIKLKPKKTHKLLTALLIVDVNGKKVFSSSLKVIPYYYQVGFKLATAISIFSLLFFTLKYVFKRKN